MYKGTYNSYNHGAFLNDPNASELLHNEPISSFTQSTHVSLRKYET
jgi:hypothetical protein